MVLHVAVIGAGSAGLASARRLKEFGLSFDVFEQGAEIGGTWIYDERFDTKVLEVKPENERWKVKICNLKTKECSDQYYDAVMVCNGHYHTPNFPEFKGQETFTGKIIHSHDYRKPEDFQNSAVVVVGAGPSGLDIALDVANHASKVFLSHHLPDEIRTKFPDNFSFKPDISKIDGNSIHFQDGTTAEVDTLLLCTGYRYSFPFLHKDCGVTVDNNHIYPLYKHLISINHPTLCLVGLPFYVCANSMFDLQARFFLSALTKKFNLSTRDEMLQDEKRDLQKRRSMGFTSAQTHKMGPLQGEYYNELSSTAGIAGIPPVMTKLHNESSRRFLEDLNNYRRDRYEIISVEYYKTMPDKAEKLNR